jgi:tetratricopeptide (TPR) repeat protein
MKFRSSGLGSPVLLVSALMLTLTACGGSEAVKKNTAPPYEQSMSQAEAYSRNGSSDQALALYQEATRANPAIKDPWLKMAQIHFDRGNYGAAVVAAEEVLKRSPADANADSILTVSGLRIAVQSLTRLRSQTGSSASQGQARVDAEILARKLRETLGDRILVPRPAAPPRPVASKPKPKPVSAPATAKNPLDALSSGSTTAVKPAAPKPVPQPKKDGTNDPFSSLKKDD